jgi:hypothetical protein
MRLDIIFTVLAIAVSLSGEPTMNYAAVDRDIDDYMSYFTTAYTEPFVKNGYDDIITKELTIEDPNIGTEGVGITKYKNKAGDTVRIYFWYMGERGQVEKNIYVTGDYYYVTELRHYYSSYTFMADGIGDILDSEFSEYIVYNDRTYLIDRISERLLPIDEAVISEYEWGYFEG